jgi:L-asparaginase II
VTVVAEVVRSGFVESRHHGSLVALSPSRDVLFSVGDVTSPVYPRSCNKPIQAVGVLRLGIADRFGLDLRHVALATASHGGEPMHVDVVRDLLTRAGLDESALSTPPDWPLDAAAARAADAPSPILMNCSGKHASFLAACVAQGWPTDGYAAPDHPLQRHLRGVVTELAGEAFAGVGVDGCGAPIVPLSLTGLARAFGRVAVATDGAESVVAQAIRTHPLLLGGTGRDVTQLVERVPGLIAKDGAEGVYATALPDGTAVALKIEDGTARARPAVMVAALRRLGVDVTLDLPPVLGGGRPVGEVRAVLTEALAIASTLR